MLPLSSIGLDFWGLARGGIMNLFITVFSTEGGVSFVP